MGSVGTSAGPGNGPIKLGDTEYISLDTTEAYNEIMRFMFSNRIVHSDGTVTGPLKGAGSASYKVIQQGTKIHGYNHANDLVGWVQNSNPNRFVVEGTILNTDATSRLNALGYVQVGSSSPNNFVPYYLWEKRK